MSRKTAIIISCMPRSMDMRWSICKAWKLTDMSAECRKMNMHSEAALLPADRSADNASYPTAYQIFC